MPETLILYLDCETSEIDFALAELRKTTFIYLVAYSCELLFVYLVVFSMYPNMY